MRLAGLLLALTLLPCPALAEGRIALLIGNQAYTGKVQPLKSPHNDIKTVAKALEADGFKVTLLADANRRQMLGAVKTLAAELAKLGPTAIGFLYYSGHGVARPEDRANYLIPIDLKDTDSTDFWFDAVKLDDVLGELERAAPFAAHFVVFDACRDELKLPYKSASKGFEPVAERSGMFIAFATALGAVALDESGGGTGPYSAALAGELVKPGQDHLQLFQNVKEDVYAATAHRQVPWERNGLLKRIFFASPTPAFPGAPAIASPSNEAAEAWDRTKDTTSIALLETFISRYKDTYYADLARARIEGLKKRQVAIATPPTPPPARPAARCDGTEAQVGDKKRCLKPKDTFRDCPDCPEMVVVPAGRFTMGSPSSEQGRFDEEGPQHEVKIGVAFAVGRYAVTRGEYAAFVRETNHATGEKCWTFENDKSEERTGRSFRNPGFAQDDQHPVVCVNWDDAKAFATWLSKKTGKSYRLLSEAEREYVTRAGSTTRYTFGDDASGLCRYGNVADQTAKRTIKGAEKWTIADCDDGYAYTAPVGKFAANAFGVHDVHGNVWEWTEDCWHYNYEGAPTDGSAWTSGDCSRRMVRGGSWYDDPRFLRSASRGRGFAGFRYVSFGFRLARTLHP